MVRARRIALVLSAAMAAWSCSSNDDGSSSKEICSPGTTLACLGPGQCDGAQVCAEDGASYGPCDCGSTGSGGTAGASGSAATGASGGAAGSAGSSAAGGSAGSAGAGATGGSAGSAGAGATGGSAGSAGAGATGGSGAGGTAATGGAAGSAGSAGASGSSGTSGSAGDGGSAGACQGVSRRFEDDFGRADGGVGIAVTPAQAYQTVSGDLSIASGELIATSNGTGVIAVDVPGIGYANVTLRMKLRLGDLSNEVSVRWARDVLPSGTYTGIGLVLIGPTLATQNFAIEEDILEASTKPMSLAKDVDYFAELVVDGADGTATLATGNYASMGGTVVESITTTGLEQDMMGSFVTIHLVSAFGASPAVDELSIDAADCG